MQRRRWVSTFKYEDEEWMEKEGIPIYQADHAIEDITELPRQPWARLGGKGTFIELEATKKASMHLYVAEIPAGGALEPERHLYDELILILRGRGLSEVWHEGQGKITFEWGEGSLFAIPLNAWHRLVNGGREPVLIFAKNSAPLVMNTFRNTEFIFNCPYNFTDRFAGQADYFLASEKRYRNTEKHYRDTEPLGGTWWDTNFVPDVRTAFLYPSEGKKVLRGKGIRFKMSAWGYYLATDEWPVGIYHKAHYHAPGVVLVGLKGEGYTLLWPCEYGIHPFQDGHGDKVIKVGWKPGSIFSPQDYWFHAHYNTGKEPAGLLRMFGGGILQIRHPTAEGRGREGNEPSTISLREGGRMIEYEDEDPEIRRMFEEELRQKGVECAMPPVVYRTDPFKLSL